MDVGLSASPGFGGSDGPKSAKYRGFIVQIDERF